jgi:hypothetical protein
LPRATTTLIARFEAAVFAAAFLCADFRAQHARCGVRAKQFLATRRDAGNRSPQ